MACSLLDLRPCACKHLGPSRASDSSLCATIRRGSVDPAFRLRLHGARSRGGGGIRRRRLPWLAAVTARRAELAVREALPRPAAPRQDAASLRIEARTPDPRLRLTACAQPLQARFPEIRSGIGPRTVVTVHCPGPTRWSVLVPVTVEAEVTVLVASRALARGVPPGPADLIQVTRTVQGFSNSYVNNLSDIEGFHLGRPLAAGTPLERAMLRGRPGRAPRRKT